MSDPQIWAEIDLEAYAHNVSTLKRLTRPETLFMAVVKANAYGHGAVEVAHRAIRSGADWLGVARFGEALQLRKAGLGAPILIFGHTPATAVDSLLDLDLTQTIFTREAAGALSSAAGQRGQRLRTHIKVDTGMGRLGLPWSDSAARSDRRVAVEHILDDIEAIMRLDGLTVEGVFTHFASADNRDKTHAQLQLRRFQELVAGLDRRGLEIPIKHTANSAAILSMPTAHFDLVRAGIATYGLYPAADMPRDRVELMPALQWKSRIVQLKQVPAGFDVSYGGTYTTPKPTTLATVAAGYADGLSRGLSSRGRMLVCGRRAPIVGRVCMDLTVLDLGDTDSVSVGDEAVIIGRQKDTELTADEMAAALETINYEIVTSIADRVPRIYST